MVVEVYKKRKIIAFLSNSGIENMGLQITLRRTSGWKLSIPSKNTGCKFDYIENCKENVLIFELVRFRNPGKKSSKAAAFPISRAEITTSSSYEVEGIRLLTVRKSEQKEKLNEFVHFIDSLKHGLCFSNNVG